MKSLFPKNPGLFLLFLYTVSLLIFFIINFLIIGKGFDLDKYCITDLNFYGEYPLNSVSEVSSSPRLKAEKPQEEINHPLKKKL